MTDIANDELLDWIENTNDGEGPDPVASFERSDLDALYTALRERDDAERDLARAVDSVHSKGTSWAVIGSILGMTRQGAHAKYANRAD